MSHLWQNALALSVVSISALYLVARGIRWWRAPAEGGCGSACGGCKSAKPLVTLELPIARPRGRS